VTDEPEEWLARRQRRGALLVLAAGVILFVPSLIWMLAYQAWGGAEQVYVVFVGVIATAIGAILTVVGLLMWLRRRRLVHEPIPSAKLHRD
jgi:hypothetical protein